MGAIKRTTVEFIVHNKKDFDTIFLPNFLKPGATVVVDYGWSEQRVNLYSVEDVINKDDVFLEKLKTTIYGGTSNGEVPDEEFAGRADQNLKLFEIDPSLKGTSKDTRKAAWDGMRKKPSVVGFINEEENKGIVDTVVGKVITYNASVTEQGSFQCSLELVSENSSLLDAEVTEDNSLKFLFDNKIEDLLISILGRGDNVTTGTTQVSIFNSLSKEEKARVNEEFYRTLNLRGEMDPDKAPNKDMSKNTVIPTNSLKAGIFYQSITDKKPDSINREVLYIAYGLFEDLFLNGIIAENQSKSRVSVNFNTEDTFVRYDINLIHRQQQILYEDEELPLFLYPSSWTDTYNGTTEISVVESQKNPPPIDEDTPGTPIIPLREVFISAELISNSFKSKQNVNDALEDIIEKINTDSYGVFKLKMISLNNSFSSISLQDANLIPLPPDDPIEILTFDVTSGNSIVYSMDYKFEMPKGGLQNMIAIGQNDSMEFLDNASKDNLNFLNILGPDRKLFGAEKLFFRALPLAKPKKNEADEKADDDSKPNKDFAFKVPKNLIPDIKYQGDITTQFANLIKNEQNNGGESDTNSGETGGGTTNIVKIVRNTDLNGKKTLDCESTRDFYGKLASLSTVLSNKKTAVPPILPISISLTIYGNTYLNVGDTILVNFLPDFYKENIFFQITNINHKLGSNWETTYDTVMRLRPDRKGIIVDTDELEPRISKSRIISEINSTGEDMGNDGVANTVMDGETVDVSRSGYKVVKIRHRYDAQGFLVSRQQGKDPYTIYTTFPKPKSIEELAMSLAFYGVCQERIGAGGNLQLGYLNGKMMSNFKMNMYFTKLPEYQKLQNPQEVYLNEAQMALNILVEDKKDKGYLFDFSDNKRDAIYDYLDYFTTHGAKTSSAYKPEIESAARAAVMKFISSQIGQYDTMKVGKKLTDAIIETYEGTGPHTKQTRGIINQDGNRAKYGRILDATIVELSKNIGPIVSQYGFTVPMEGTPYVDEQEDIFSYKITVNSPGLIGLEIFIPEWFLGTTKNIDMFISELDDLYGGNKYNDNRGQAKEGKIGILSSARQVIRPLLEPKYYDSIGGVYIIGEDGKKQYIEIPGVVV